MIRMRRFAITLAAFTWAIHPAAAEYRLGPGDVMEISVFGVADMKRRVTVNVDGNVSMPFLGEVHAGRTHSRYAGAVRLADGLLRTGTLQITRCHARNHGIPALFHIG